MRKLFAVLGLAVLLSMPSLAFAATTIDASSTGLSTTGTAAFGTNISGANNSSLPAFIGFYIIQPILGLVGLAFFCLMLYAGILWMTAAGEPKKVDKAKGILVNSVIGVVIIVASYALTNAMLSAVTTGAIT